MTNLKLKNYSTIFFCVNLKIMWYNVLKCLQCIEYIGFLGPIFVPRIGMNDGMSEYWT